LGELDTASIQRVLSHKSDENIKVDQIEGKKFIAATQCKCFELLSGYIKSPSKKSALVAMNTATALLLTTEGASSWNQVSSLDCKLLLSPVMASRAQNEGACMLSHNHFDEFITLHYETCKIGVGTSAGGLTTHTYLNRLSRG
jgi:hypothetical protein